MDTLLVVEDDNYDVQSRTFRTNTHSEEEQVNLRVHLSRSLNTRKSYESHWRLFTNFCDSQNLLPFPASLETITLFLQSRYDEGVLCPSLEMDLAAIRAVHTDNRRFISDELNIGIFDSRLSAILKSFRRQYVEAGKSGTAKPHAFSQEDISALLEVVSGNDFASIQQRSLLLIGFNTGMRISELLSLRVSDVTINHLGVDIYIQNSKTDQFGGGDSIFVHRLAPSQIQFDAVSALEKWIHSREQLVEQNAEQFANVGELFIPLRRNNTTVHLVNGKAHAFSREAFTKWFKAISLKAGIHSTGHFGSHSLRHTFATQAFRRGISASTIALTTRHKNLRVLMEYNQQSRVEQSISPQLWG